MPAANIFRTCLKEAPDNLIFHLKRFEFDLNDFSRRKIYDHFAFPETLDISPYKIDHLSDPTAPCEEDLFDLVGVLVHTGTCENGHYYSYIRQRPSSTKATRPTWVEFNDSEVGPFDPSEIAERTFGGFTEIDGYTRQIKQFSAYMLFYQRRAAMDKDQRHWATTSSDCTPQIATPKLLEQETNAQNEQFIREYTLYDPVHAKFVRQLQGVSRAVNHGTCSEDHDQEARALHIALAHLCHTAWRQYNPDIFLDLLFQIRRSMLSCSACSGIVLQWLALDDHAMTNIFIKCTHPKIRSQTRALVIDGLKFLREKEPTLYGAESTDSDVEVDSTSSTEGVLVNLAMRLRKTAGESSESTRGWEDFYLLLTQMAEMGLVETAVLLNCDFLYFCLRLFCMSACPPFKAESPEFARIMEKRRSIFNRLVFFLWKLLSQTDLSLLPLNDEQVSDRLVTLDRDRMKFPLHKRELLLLGWWSDDLKAIAVIDKILEVFDDTKVDHFYPGDIIRWMLESPNDVLQTNLCRTIIEGLLLDPPYCDSYVYAALPFCQACPKGDNIAKIINAIAKAIASTNRAVDDRLPSGEAVLRFFDGLLNAQNEDLFIQKHPHAFHQALMARSRIFGIPMLCHFDERVRRSTYTLFQQLYSNDDAIPPETGHIKYDSARELLLDMMHKFGYERDIGRHRSFMVPLVDTCRLLAEQIYSLSQSQEPEMKQFQDSNDAGLICQFQQEVEARMRLWPHDAETPLSQGDTFDQSDYGSESDDTHDLLEN
jgi:ubiquitin carboxyl-terminal hydrolase 34